MGFAIVDAGYTATAFCYVYEIERKQFTEEKALIPFGFPRGFQAGWQQTWRLKKGKQLWEIIPQDNQWQVAYTGKKIRLAATFAEPHPGLSAIAEGRPFHFTYKNTALATQAQLDLESRSYTQQGPVGVLDFSLGYPPRTTFWNWASLAGQTETGEPVGINLVGVFNAGRENGLWLGGRLIPLAPARFTYEKPLAEGPWHIRTDCGTVEMAFKPQGARAENLNLGVAKSIFSQPFGTFSGTLRVQGATLPFSGHGVVEEHLARW
jgi:hypothetical protein